MNKVQILHYRERKKKTEIQLALWDWIEMSNLSGALPSGQVSKKGCLPGREIYFPGMTGWVFFRALHYSRTSGYLSS